MALQHETIKPEIGSRVLSPKEDLLSGEYAEEIRNLLEERGVLVFPKIDFEDDEQIAFTKTLGTLYPEHNGEELHKITLDPVKTPSADYLKGSMYWHLDGTMNDKPIFASLLSGKVLSTKAVRRILVTPMPPTSICRPKIRRSMKRCVSCMEPGPPYITMTQSRILRCSTR
jgi:alpha-ketoglutarate-dependent taurine dioxygenase